MVPCSWYLIIQLNWLSTYNYKRHSRATLQGILVCLCNSSDCINSARICCIADQLASDLSVYKQQVLLLIYPNVFYVFLTRGSARSCYFTRILDSWWYLECIHFTEITKGSTQKKITGLFGNFSQTSDPPPFWEPLVQKKKLCLFCILGVKDQFCSSQKNHFLSGISTTSFGNRGPPPLLGKNPK